MKDTIPMESAMEPKCEHEEAFKVDDGLWCPDCNCIVGVTCFACGGEGYVEEDEYELDWINYGSDLITCPDCGGTGIVKEPKYG